MRFVYSKIFVTVIILATLMFAPSCQSQEEAAHAAAEVEYAAIMEKQIRIQSTPTKDIPETLIDIQAENSDACGWLLVPNTDVTLPIMTSGEGEGFYLTHDYKKAYSPFGSAYIEQSNAPDFSDSVTVIYGHSSNNVPLLFSQLHDFENRDFLKENRCF